MYLREWTTTTQCCKGGYQMPSPCFLSSTPNPIPDDPSGSPQLLQQEQTFIPKTEFKLNDTMNISSQTSLNLINFSSACGISAVTRGTFEHLRVGILPVVSDILSQSYHDVTLSGSAESFTTLHLCICV